MTETRADYKIFQPLMETLPPDKLTTAECVWSLEAPLTLPLYRSNTTLTTMSMYLGKDLLLCGEVYVKKTVGTHLAS